MQKTGTVLAAGAYIALAVSLAAGVATADPSAPRAVRDGGNAPTGQPEAGDSTASDRQFEASRAEARQYEARARRIALSDGVVQKILRGRTHAVAGVEPVIEGERVVGAALTFSLDRPVTADLPVKDAGSHGEHAEKPRVGAAGVRITDLTQLLVVVNVEAGHVVDVTGIDGSDRQLLDENGDPIAEEG